MLISMRITETYYVSYLSSRVSRLLSELFYVSEPTLGGSSEVPHVYVDGFFYVPGHLYYVGRLTPRPSKSQIQYMG